MTLMAMLSPGGLLAAGIFFLCFGLIIFEANRFLGRLNEDLLGERIARAMGLGRTSTGNYPLLMFVGVVLGLTGLAAIAAMIAMAVA